MASAILSVAITSSFSSKPKLFSSNPTRSRSGGPERWIIILRAVYPAEKGEQKFYSVTFARTYVDEANCSELSIKYRMRA
jgi:hypothetical protein